MPNVSTLPGQVAESWQLTDPALSMTGRARRRHGEVEKGEDERTARKANGAGEATCAPAAAAPPPDSAAISCSRETCGDPPEMHEAGDMLPKRAHLPEMPEKAHQHHLEIA